MAQSLDLQEQEQLDQLKHFWSRYGNAITWGLILVLGAVAAWNGWQYWQRMQANSAAVLYDEIERAVTDKDVERVERALADMKDRFGRTTYAHQSALLAARGFHTSGKTEAAKAALVWTAEQSGDEGLEAIARLRLASLALEASDPQAALKWLQTPTVPEFAGLVADRLGDVYLAQAKKNEARAEFEKAYQLLEAGTEYRQLVEVKLNALGVDPQAAAPAAVTK